MRTLMSWSEEDIEVEEHYLDDYNYEALAVFHATCASQLMLSMKPKSGVFYNTTPFPFVEAQIHAQLSTTFATLAVAEKKENNGQPNTK